MSSSPFLTAEWRYLVMLNFVADPALLKPSVPLGTELDFHQGETFVSLVGFRFLRTRMLGLPIPLHRDFEESLSSSPASAFIADGSPVVVRRKSELP